MQSNLDIKVSSLFKEKKQNNRIVKIKIDSDSEDNQSIKEKEPLESNDISNTPPDFEEKEKKSKTGNINLDENKENIKSSSQSSISTSISQSNNSTNSKNFPARPKKSDIFSQKNENYLNDQNSEENDLFNISSGTKKILEKIREKRRKAKNESKNDLNNINYSYYDVNSKKDVKKFIGKKTKSYEPNNNAETKNKGESIKLSERTQEAIKKLKKLRNNKFLNESKELIVQIKENRNNSFSNLHVKYEELLQQSRELRLPVIYKKLYESFISLDRTINRNKKENKNDYNTFNNLRNILVSYTNKNFNINIFKQILYIVPHFYILKYINNTKSLSIFSLNDNLDKNYDLLIDIPSDFNERIKRNYSNDFNFLDINYYSETNNNYEPILRYLTEKEMNQRKQIFLNILNYIVNDYHEKFLKENKIKIKFNPLTQKTWHHNFDPDKHCSPIPYFEFPSPPEYKSIFVETINKNDIKAQITSIKYDDNNTKKNKSGTSSANKFVSEDYIKKIRAKEQALNIVKEINQFNYYYNQKNDRDKIIKNMLLQIKTLLMTHQKSLELNVLSDLIINSNRIFKDFFENTQKINSIIIDFCKNYEGFINIINHSRLGLIVVLVNSEYQIPDKFNNI